MQKLRMDNRGSVLVGTLIVGILVTVSGLGLISVISSAVNNEVNALEDDQAFLAAETGAMMGARWLRGKTVFPSGGTVYPFSLPLVINGMKVNVSLTTQTDSGGSVYVTISSEAHDGNASVLDGTTFRKRITWRTQPSTFGMYSTFFDDVYSGHSNWGGFYRRTFEGRFHMNTYIEISPHSRPNGDNPVLFKNGLVTVASPQRGGYGNGAHDDNNYDYGVELNFNDYDPAGQLDQIFTDEYRGAQEHIDIPDGLTTSDLQGHAGKIELPVSEDQGEDYYHYRPTLEFRVVNGAAEAVYHYRSGGIFKEQVYSDIDGAVFICTNNLNVFGEVRGSMTVATRHGKSIMPVDDIVYSDFDKSSGEVPSASSNVLGLVSGKDIRFNSAWYKQFKGDRYGDTRTINGGDGTIDLNASILAVESGSNWQGTEYWDTSRKCNYNLRLTGNHILKSWRYPTSTSSYGTPLGGCMGYINNQHDFRLIERLQPPGFPSVRTSGGLWVLNFRNWNEENVY